MLRNIFSKKAIASIVIFVALERLTYYQTGGFTPYKIVCADAIKGDNHVDAKAKTILDQPFYYLGKGVQFFVFESRDGNYVLKFVKHHRTSPRFWFSSGKAERRIDHIVQSCQLAYSHLKSETGLLAIHLTPDATENHMITLVDNLGIAHPINLNTTSYLLQKKGENMSERPLTQVDIANLVDLIKNRYEQGIVNKDPRPRNFGFVGSIPIEIDLGSFKQPSPDTLPTAFQKEQLKWKRWLENYDPSLADYFMLQMEAN